MAKKKQRTKEKKSYLAEFKADRKAGKKPRKYSAYVKATRGKTKATIQKSKALRKAGLSYEKIAKLQD